MHKYDLLHVHILHKSQRYFTKSSKVNLGSNKADHIVPFQYTQNQYYGQGPLDAVEHQMQ